jgi:tyrosine-protein phosphatase non-receptor type 5
MTPILATDRPPSFAVKPEYLAQYDQLNKESGAPPYATEALQHTIRNRYVDVLPFQENIFRFQNTSLYFNASCLLQGRAISCQGPLEIEHKHFWRMVWESQATAIVMTTDLVERSTPKCSWYLPLETGASLPASTELPEELEIQVTQIAGPPKPTKRSPPDLIERVVELEYQGEKRTVCHYHFTGWNDHKTAPENLLAQLVAVVWQKHYCQGARLIVHCSAGIGRSGTFLATLEAFSQLQKEADLPEMVLGIVKNLRSHNEGRKGMVQTKAQYELIFKALAILDEVAAKQFCLQASL